MQQMFYTMISLAIEVIVFPLVRDYIKDKKNDNK